GRGGGASRSVLSISPESALRRSGRFMVSTATPSLTVSSKSWLMGFSLISVPFILGHALHGRAVGVDRAHLRCDPPPSVPARPHRRLACAGRVPVLRDPGRALPARLRARAVHRRRPCAARGLDHHAQRALRGGAPRRTLPPRNVLPRLRTHREGRRGGTARADKPRLYQLSAG